MVADPEPWQLRIPFARLVSEALDPVLEPAGYEATVIKPNLVRYSNGAVILDVSHHPRDGEVAVNFGRSGSERVNSLLLYLGWKAPSHPASASNGVSWTSDEVERSLRTMADALGEHGQPILENDDATFERMSTLRWWDVQPEFRN